jgi:flagellar biosynthesis chaperone FliJ
MCVLAAGLAQAEVHRWVDKDGNVHFGDTVPPEYADQIGGRGSDPGAGSASAPEPAVTESIAGEEIERRKEAARRAEADRVLLRTYLSVEEIEDVRDRRIDQLESQNSVTERYLGRLNQQLADLELAATEYEAANSEPGTAVEIPADLQRDIDSTRASIADYEARLATNRTEQERIREKFAVDIARFRELKGLPPEGTTASQ